MSSRTPAPASVRKAFEGHIDVPVVLEAVLEGVIGTLHVSPDSEAVRADIGCYSFFGGPADPQDPVAVEWMRSALVPTELMYGQSAQWKGLADRIHGDRLDPRPMRWFRGDELDAERLDDMQTVHHDGYELLDFDTAMASQLGPQLQPHALQTYDSPDHLLQHGIGVGVVHDEQLVCAATSYAMSSSGVEIAISTHPEHRGKGLAQSASAAICLAILDRGLMPHWHASNPVSQRLAVRLGFKADREIPIDFLLAPEP